MKPSPTPGLIDDLIASGFLKTRRVIDAFRSIKRVDFLPGYFAEGSTNVESLAELDEALPIGHGQTISQPAVVAFMLELLEIKGGNNILDIGFGSGWTTALMASIAGSEGRVTAIERIKELCDFGRQNINKYNFIEKGNVQTICGDGSLGYVANAPYDRILASAAAETIPPAWLDQLRSPGIMVAPQGTSIKKFKKNGRGKISIQEFQGFVFVPLVQSK